MSHSPLDLLHHILEETQYLMRDSEGLSLESFLTDETKKRSFTRSIEVIGEAAKKLPDEFKKKYDQVDWKPIMRMRDKLIHHYFGVDYELVWDTVESDIPSLKKEIERIINAEQNEVENA